MGSRDGQRPVGRSPSVDDLFAPMLQMQMQGDEEDRKPGLHLPDYPLQGSGGPRPSGGNYNSIPPNTSPRPSAVDNASSLMPPPSTSRYTSAAGPPPPQDSGQFRDAKSPQASEIMAAGEHPRKAAEGLHDGRLSNPTSDDDGGLGQEGSDERKQKRMLSNRESARRSRMRKQQHLDELKAQVAQLRAENHHMAQKYSIAARHYAQLNEENRMLRHHAVDLSRTLHRLEAVARPGMGGMGGGGYPHPR
eukprot:TRINITY_DN17832_c0_g1_i1.p1 TRINITY_DN17832_c0_g1~~TRINITY_DN17832_c0_g1_i1.p1  ORF type:complete len:248 (-),score=44.64 TRINITY_DN17832_c0_g1_i1:849-1592(-)